MKNRQYRGDASLIFIDFKEAFDTIDHKILSERINRCMIEDKISNSNGTMLLQYLSLVYNNNTIQVGEKYNIKTQVKMCKGVL